MTDIQEVAIRINAMREQEARVQRCQNYFAFCVSSDVDMSCRKAMVDWCFQVADTLQFNHETVGLAMSFLDRYLSSRRGRSHEALACRKKFQLASITCFYTAVKTYEPVEIGVNLLVKMCRGFYSEADIISMESDILFALDWRVSAPTPMDFVRQFAELLPAKSSSFINQNAECYMDKVTKDMNSSFFRPSVIGAGCMISTLSQAHHFHSDELLSFMDRLAQIVDLNDVTEFHSQLNVDTTICLPKSIRKIFDVSTQSRRCSITRASTSSPVSPVCVSHASRAA